VTKFGVHALFVVAVRDAVVTLGASAVPGVVVSCAVADNADAAATF